MTDTDENQNRDERRGDHGNRYEFPGERPETSDEDQSSVGGGATLDWNPGRQNEPVPDLGTGDATPRTSTDWNSAENQGEPGQGHGQGGGI